MRHRGTSSCRHVARFLSANQLEIIPRGAFANIDRDFWGFREEHILMFSDNPIKAIETKAFRWSSYRTGMQVYLLRTKLKILSLDSFFGLSIQDARM